MGFSRQREDCKFIVKSKRSIFNRIVSMIFTILMWIYCLTIIIVFGTAIFNYNNYYTSIIKIVLKITNQDIKEFIILSIICFGFACILFVILSLWAFYKHIRRYKNFSGYAEVCLDEDILDCNFMHYEDILDLNLMDFDDYVELRNNKICIFNKNPNRN